MLHDFEHQNLTLDGITRSEKQAFLSNQAQPAPIRTEKG
jgi:hypothetical protein